MADVGFVLLLAGFFGVCVLFVKACDRIIGPEVSVTSVNDAPGTAPDGEPTGEPAEVAA